MSSSMSSESIASILTPEQKLIARLDDDFAYLLQFAFKPMEKLSTRKRELAKEWIVKLSTSIDDQNITAKLIRNDYVTKLLSCIQNEEFKPPFNQSPPPLSEPLAKIDFEFEKVTHEIPEWVSVLKSREEHEIKIGGRDFETYFSSKLLDNGACAYVALSTRNEGDSSAWMRFVPNKINKEKIDEVFANEFRDFAENEMN